MLTPPFDDPPGPSHELRLDEVHVWTIHVADDPAAATLAQFSALMSAEERERCARFRHATDRNLCTVGHAATRCILSRYTAVPPADWRFRTGEYGRPEIESPAAFSPLAFNRSHSGGLVAFAVARGRRVGIDIEWLSRRPFDDRVANDCFTRRERDRIAARPPSERNRVSFELWTLKESYVKAIGHGLNWPLRNVQFDWSPETHPTASFENGLDDPQRWDFRVLAPTPDHVLGLAVERRQGPAVVRVVDVGVGHSSVGSRQSSVVGLRMPDARCQFGPPEELEGLTED